MKYESRNLGKKSRNAEIWETKKRRGHRNKLLRKRKEKNKERVTRQVEMEGVGIERLEKRRGAINDLRGMATRDEQAEGGVV